MAFDKLIRCNSWPEAEKRLRAGASPEAVATYMQTEGEYNDVQESSLARTLYRWRSKNLAVPAQVLPPAVVDEAFERLEHGVDVLALMTDAIELQKRRIDMAHGLELSLGMLMDANNREVRLYFDMLQNWLKTLQSLGLQPQVPKQLQMLVGVMGVPGRPGQGPAEAGDLVATLLNQTENPDGAWQQLLQLETLLRGAESVEG